MHLVVAAALDFCSCHSNPILEVLKQASVITQWPKIRKKYNLRKLIAKGKTLKFSNEVAPKGPAAEKKC